MYMLVPKYFYNKPEQTAADQKFNVDAILPLYPLSCHVKPYLFTTCADRKGGEYR